MSERLAPTNPAEVYSSFTMIAFAFVSLVVYILFLRPTATPAPPRQPEATRTGGRVAPNQQPPQRPAVNNNTNSLERGQRAAGGGGGGGGALGVTSTAISENALQVLSGCQSAPSFVTSKVVGLNGTSVLVDGLVAFRHTQAASVTTSNVGSLSTDDAARIRKERAKLLSLLVAAMSSRNSGSSFSPPARGTTLVLSIPEQDVPCGKLQRILYLLATHYNLFVIVALEEKDDQLPKKKIGSMEHVQQSKEEVLKVLRNSNEFLTESVLPSHRIVLAKTSAGRIALVRQLLRVELVLDFDATVESQLTRFGYQVLLYGKAKSSDNERLPQEANMIVSALGAEFTLA